MERRDTAVFRGFKKGEINKWSCCERYGTYMTLIADIKWTCQCGVENTSQLWTTEENECGEEYINGDVPQTCDMNWDEPCSSCNAFELADEAKTNANGYKRFDVVPVKST